MKTSRLKERWKMGQLANCTVVKIKDPIVTDMASRTGFDSIWVDLEHSDKPVETSLLPISGQTQLKSMSKLFFTSLAFQENTSLNGVVFNQSLNGAEVPSAKNLETAY